MKMYAANDGSLRLNKNDSHETESSYDFIPIKGMLIPSQQLAMANSSYAYDRRYEKVLALRTELLMRRQSTEQAYMMAILSACAGEGRSQLAAELAIAFAKMNRPTLLIDADFRRPKQHVLFSTDNHSGLSQVKESDETPDLFGVKDLPQMLVMTTGEIPDNPLELLLSEKFALMIEYLRDNFEFVVIDTPPVSKFSDGLVIANLVSNVITLSRAKHTSYRHMRDMLRRLSATNSQILGGVINHF
ncbi:MAG: polysaccharide biosynthesis tyrosine autokinase [Gammaproteobacteria bacterium]|nr:polysaccharide biosynthesis tyrosine autokinase [Gammaproteobacteria bacterium]